MRRIDQLSPLVAAGIALDALAMMVFIIACTSREPQLAWAAALALSAIGGGCVARGLRSAALLHDGARRWLRRTAITSGVAAALLAIGIGDTGSGVLGPVYSVALLGAGLVHGAVWMLAVPYARSQSGVEPVAGLGYLGLAFWALLLIPAIVLLWSPGATRGDDLAAQLLIVAATYTWSLYWLAPPVAAGILGRGLGWLATGAAWGAIGLLLVPFATLSPFFVWAWLFVATLVAAVVTVGAWNDIRTVAVAAGGLTALLGWSLVTGRGDSLPESAIVATAAIGWIAVASRTSPRPVLDGIAVAAGIVLAVVPATPLDSALALSELVPPWDNGDAVAMALPVAASVLRAAYLCALAVRAIRGADTERGDTVARAIALT